MATFPTFWDSFQQTTVSLSTPPPAKWNVPFIEPRRYSEMAPNDNDKLLIFLMRIIEQFMEVKTGLIKVLNCVVP